MSLTRFSCVICGYFVESYGRSNWLKEFRALYCNAGGTFISGVGRYSDPDVGDWMAPSDSTARWDDPDYDSPASDRIPVMRQRDEDGLHGFVLHDLCWRILQKFYKPNDVPLERLLEVCRSLPFPIRGAGVWWGHDYGGLITLDYTDHYPWEDRVTKEYNSSQTHAKENPYDIAEIPRLLTLSSNFPESSDSSESILVKEKGKDCFAIFPWEIIESIGAKLLVPDILSLVRASRSFRPILASQTFWASRFEPGKDRDFVFEKRNCREYRDWIKLYQLTNRSSSPPGLKNRRRIWDLIWEFAPSLASSLDESHMCSLSDNTCDEGHEVTAEILSESFSRCRAFFYQGCLLFHKQRAAIPLKLSGIAFSITANNITGIRLVSESQEDICLGYVNKNKETILEITAVCGLTLAVGSRGVRAIRVIDSNGNESRWIGNPKDTPITERLAAFETITALEIGVDGYKIISIAASGTRSTLYEKALRLTALWYPAVPSSMLHLNDSSFTGENPLTAGYQPLAWIHFGGPNGIYLRNIKGICVTRLGGICCIEFEYNIDLPVEICKLGRRKVTEFSTTTRFQIDGRAGEYINNIDVSTVRKNGEKVYRFYKFGKLSSFKITTNYGRSAHFMDEGLTIDHLTMTPLSVDPGTILTGFYASQHPEYGIISLGAVSEVVTRRKRKRESEISDASKRSNSMPTS